MYSNNSNNKKEVNNKMEGWNEWNDKFTILKFYKIKFYTILNFTLPFLPLTLTTKTITRTN